MASNINQKIIVTSDMSIYERINHILNEQKIHPVWNEKKNLVFICEIFRGDSSFVILGHTDNIRKKLRELYNGHGANIVNIQRLVDVSQSHQDWNNSDFCSELFTCLGEYKKEDMYFGFYDGINKNNILNFFDYKIRIENFNLQYTYAISPFNTFLYEEINKSESLNRQLNFDELSDEEDFNPYNVNCVGSSYGCPEMTNGTQYCYKYYCPYEEEHDIVENTNNTVNEDIMNEGPAMKKFKVDKN